MMVTRSIVVVGDDPQQVADDGQLTYEGRWQAAADRTELHGTVHRADTAGATMLYRFRGNRSV